MVLFHIRVKHVHPDRNKEMIPFDLLIETCLSWLDQTAGWAPLIVVIVRGIPRKRPKHSGLGSIGKFAQNRIHVSEIFII